MKKAGPRKGRPSATKQIQHHKVSTQLRPDQLACLWLSLPSLSESELDRLGVSYPASLRAGGLVKGDIRHTGDLFEIDDRGCPAMLLGVWSCGAPSLENPQEQPLLLDLLALHSADPTRWWRHQGTPGCILAENLYLRSCEAGVPVVAYDSPLAWLRAGCSGIVVLDDALERHKAERHRVRLQQWEVAA